ncbi:trypsin-like serine peptidase [Plantactinospora sonchi]|uniref:Serine protease n=1 Tax=Plantactinospora sonchi TaxID=1544735 RepID=A0ABU7RU93_9ACTN
MARLVRLRSPSGNAGCGYLIAPDLVLTCHHLVPTRSAARLTGILGPAGHRRRPDPGRFVTCRSLDYTLVGLECRPGSGAAPEDPPRSSGPAPHDELVLVQPRPTDPSGFRLTRLRVTDTAGPFLRYDGRTTYGSSGAPIFDTCWQLVAMHQRRGCLDGGGRTAAIVGEGVRVAAVVARLDPERDRFRGGSDGARGT